MEPIDTLAERAATYGLLARLYHHEVDERLLAKLRLLDWNAATDTLDDDGSDGGRLVSGYLGECGCEATTELAVDFARLFLVRTAGEDGAPYPFESVYASDEHTVMGDARDRVLASYREEGLGKSASWNLPEDHLALELEFMQTLCNRTVEALRNGDDAEARRLSDKQQEFLERHLLSWTTPFTRALEDAAQTSFYRGLALITQSFLAEEGRAVAALRD